MKKGTKKKYYWVIGIAVIIIVVLIAWIISSPKNIFNSSCPSCYEQNILYCEKDEDCTVWWGPYHCGCGNKYYVFSEEEREYRPTLTCEGPINYECQCINNKCS